MKAARKKLGITGNTLPKKGTPLYTECKRLMAEINWTRIVWWDGGSRAIDWSSRLFIWSDRFSIHCPRWRCPLMVKQWKRPIEFLLYGVIDQWLVVLLWHCCGWVQICNFSLKGDIPLLGSCIPVNNIIWDASHLCGKCNCTTVTVHLDMTGRCFVWTQQNDSFDLWRTYILLVKLSDPLCTLSLSVPWAFFFRNVYIWCV